MCVLFCSALPAEASHGSWWSRTGRSRRLARNLRSSLLVQTGNEAVPLGAGRADCHTAISLGGILITKSVLQTLSGEIWA